MYATAHAVTTIFTTVNFRNVEERKAGFRLFCGAELISFSFVRVFFNRTIPTVFENTSMAWLATIPYIYGILHFGPILFWAVAIGAEYLMPERKKVARNVFAGCMFLIAIGGEFVAVAYDEYKDPGVQVTQRFQAKDAEQQIFTISSDPIPGSVELYDNSLQEDETNFSSQGRAVRVTMKLNRTDIVTIKYRHKSE